MLLSDILIVNVCCFVVFVQNRFLEFIELYYSCFKLTKVKQELILNLAERSYSGTILIFVNCVSVGMLEN